jgi:transcriptional regulator with XRE-family HTH domain
MSRILSYCQRNLAAMSVDEVRELARKTGVTFPQVQRIRYRLTPNPGIESVERIYLALLERPVPVPLPEKKDR